jgi:hypothetical protein
MTQQKRPEWVQKAAQAVTALMHQQQQDVEHAKEHMQASEARLKTDAHTTQEKIADIIHRHYQEHK